MYDKAHIYIRMNTRGDNAKNRNNNEQRIKSNGWKGIWRCQAVFSLHTFIIKLDFWILIFETYPKLIEQGLKIPKITSNPFYPRTFHHML